MTLIVGIYVVWFAAATGMYLLGAPSSIMGMMLGAPIGWTLGILLILGFYRWKARG